MAMAQSGMLLHYLQRLAAGSAAQATDRQLLDDFVQFGDEAAFTALVARHGPMVLRICRRVLGHEHDAEDAFQATFLVLAQHGSSIRKRGAVSEWLHGVAYRTAMKAKRSAARRRNHEAKSWTTTKAATGSPSWEDVQAILDEEIQQLPRSGREAFVLCVLQGKSGAEAAAELGCKEGTVKSRLNRARRTLQQRLARRAIELSAVLAALAIADSGGAALPMALLRTAVHLGLLSVRGGATAGTIPKHLAALATGVGEAMFHSKSTIAVCVLLAVGLIAGGAGVLARQIGKPARAGGTPKLHVVAAQLAHKALGPPFTHEASKRIEVSGRVLGSDGHPVAGARLFVCDEFANRSTPQAPTDRAGRFHFALAASELPAWRVLVAKMDGLGVDWIRLTPGEPPRGLTLHLPVDVPIDGKVVGLEGQPVAHAAVRLVQLSTPSTDPLDEFLKRWTASKEKSVFTPAYPLLFEKSLQARAALEQLASATTDAQGRFHLAGIGRDRAVLVGIRAPGMADHYVRALLRPDFQTQPGQVTLFGTQPTAVLSPAKPVFGTVRDALTKQPLAGVRVLGYTPSKPMDWSWRPIETVTDAHGHYRLDGLSKASQKVLLFDPGPGTQQIHRFDQISDTPSFTPIVHDAQLHRGILVHGQVVDQATGRPVRARVVYAPLQDNRFYGRTPGYRRPKNVSSWITSREMITNGDGRYRLTAIPGHGALFVQALVGPERFTQPTVPKDERDPAIYHARADTFLTLGEGDLFPMGRLHADCLIRPTVGSTETVVNFALKPALRRRGRLLDPHGQPLAGARAYNLACLEDRPTVLAGSDFSAGGLSATRPRRLLLWHHQRKLAGTVVLRGDEREPVTVTLQPLATVTGRALGKNGQALVGYRVEYDTGREVYLPNRRKRFDHQPILTDHGGRFRMDDVPSGMPIEVRVFGPQVRLGVAHQDGIVLKPAETKDLGDLRSATNTDDP